MTTVASKLKPERVIAHGVMKDGRQVLLVAEGKVSRLKKRQAARNHERWSRGLRPNRFGIWR